MTRRNTPALTAALLGLCTLIVAPATLAHTAWLEPGASDDSWLLKFGGHGGKYEPAAPEKLREVRAVAADGKPLPLRRQPGDDTVLLQVFGTPALITLHYDNGIYSRRSDGPSVNRPMSEVPGATSAVNALKYHKTIVNWGPQATQPQGQVFEVVPLNATPPQAGQPFAFEVRLNGQPLAGAKYGRGEDDGSGETDARGRASFVPEAGFNKLWAGQRQEIADHPDFTQLSYEYALGFFVE
ncbi:MAG: DUF4198 domain-containing protein [Oceanococcaceae bacterium]